VPVLGRVRTRLPSTDGWIAVGFVVAATVETAIRYRHQPALLAADLPGAAAFGCLVFRRTKPLLTMSVLTIVFVVASLLQATVWSQRSDNAVVPIFALLVVSFSLGAHASRRQLWWGAWQPVLIVLTVDVADPNGQSLAGAALFVVVFISAAPIVAGRLVQGRSRLVRRLRAQAAEIDAQKQLQIDTAVAEERLRMARRFDDTLAAGLDVIASQVTVLTTADATHDIGTIERTARELLARTREEVVALASPTPPAQPAERVAAAEPDFGDSAQRWTVLLGGAMCAGLLVETRSLPLHAPLPVACLACVVAATPLALAWLRPLLAISALWLLVGLFDVFIAPLHGSFTAVGLAFVPPFAVAALEPHRRALLGLAACLAGEFLCVGNPSPTNAAVAGCCWLGGSVLHDRMRLAEQLRVNNAVLDGQRDAAAEHAVAEERLRMARDLHDALGHSLTVIALQAGAARRIAATDPARARAALQTVAAVAHDGLDELHSGARHTTAQEAMPTLAALIDRARTTGLRIEAHVDDVEARLTADTRIALYRVIQEALTNALKHAPGSSVTLSVRDGGSHVDVVLSNCAPTTPVAASVGTRHGLRSMRARVEAAAGQISWGRRADGGFEVCATLPAASAPA
jgi:signal transduction histidine kinase